MRPLEDWIAWHLTPEAAYQIGIYSLAATVLCLNTVNMILIGKAREAIQNFRPPEIVGQGLLTTEVQLLRLKTARIPRQDGGLNLKDMEQHLDALSELEPDWVNLNHVIIRYFNATVWTRRREWEHWLEALERAGTAIWLNAANAGLINRNYPFQGARLQAL